jgi:hypothetical protein
MTMLNALKAMTATLPRFPHPIQPLVKSDRLDAYRARQIAPATPMSQRVSRRNSNPLAKAKRHLAKTQQSLKWTEWQLRQQKPGTATYELHEDMRNTAANSVAKMEARLDKVRRALPRRRRLHNGRLAKLNRGRG